MSIEGILTRELDIRFIDARELVNEAKMALGITGYPTQEMKETLRNEAIQIFKRRSQKTQERMRHLNTALIAAKSAHSNHSSSHSYADSIY